MSVVYTYCHALYWASERVQDSMLSSTTMFKTCCKKGAVWLTNFQTPPRVLQQLLEGIGPWEKHFRKHIWQYNAALTFTSMGCQREQCTITQGPNLFEVYGKIYHMQGLLDTDVTKDAVYTQLFFYNPAYATNLHHCQNVILDHIVLSDLSQMLKNVNLFIGIY